MYYLAQKGCRLKVDEENDYAVTGNACPRGAEYGKNELKNPKKSHNLNSKTNSTEYCRCPVKTNGAIPKGKMFEIMKMLDDVELKTPIRVGDIVIEKPFDTGVDIVACKEILK